MKKDKIKEVDLAELERVKARLKQGKLEEHDRIMLIGFLDILKSVLLLFQQGRQTIRRLKAMLFGAPTERSRNLNGKTQSPDSDKPETGGKPGKASGKRKGHGRLGVKQFPGAKRIAVAHGDMKVGEACPHGCGGKLYDTERPSQNIRFVAQPLIDATIYELQHLRCSKCGETNTAELPKEAQQKYDENVGPTLGVARYGYGLPMNRMVDLQKMFGIPMALGTQYEEIEVCYNEVGELFMTELIRQAARGMVVYNDDTPARVLDLERAIKEKRESLPPGEKIRTGIFTSGIVSTREDCTTVVYLTGNKHAGENLHDVLVHRPEDMDAPMQMSDASNSNATGLKTYHANCGSHARREFVEIIDSHMKECTFVTETYRRVYINEAHAKKAGLSKEERLLYHQQNSLGPMDAMHDWMEKKLDTKEVEPNSALGGAIKYCLKRWEKLTLFLRMAGAPIDNNICERILKTSIRHRNNSLFYKTEKGARIGDFFMSAIQTCRFANVNPINYLTTLRKRVKEFEANPGNWMPWNYQLNDAVPS